MCWVFYFNYNERYRMGKNWEDMDIRGRNGKKHLQPPAKDKNDWRYIKMREGLARYQEQQRIKKETAAQSKQNLEQIFQKLALDDLAEAVSNGSIDGDTINVALKAAETIQEIEKISLKDRTKDLNEMWKFCMNQLRIVTGQESAKKAEQTLDLRDNSNLTKDELMKKAAEFKAKFGHEPNVIPIAKENK